MPSTMRASRARAAVAAPNRSERQTSSPLTSDDEEAQQEIRHPSTSRRTVTRTGRVTRNVRAYNGEASDSDDSFDSGSEVDMDDTADYMGPGRGSKRVKQTRVPKAKKTATTEPKSRSAKTGAKKNPIGGSRSTKLGKSRLTAPLRGAAHLEDLAINDDIPLFSACARVDLS